VGVRSREIDVGACWLPETGASVNRASGECPDASVKAEMWLTPRDVLVDGPKAAAQLACRPGPLSAETIERLWRQLGSAFPTA
jgi:hypothetical protein